LGYPPREAFLAAQAQSGIREHLYIPYNEEFEMMILPTTIKGTARVVPGRGVKINYIYYWSEGFRNPEVEKSRVPVRFDPFNAGRAYAYVKGQWRTCISEYQLIFNNRSERELMIASAELRRRFQRHGHHFSITARKLADFLVSLAIEEQKLLYLQRRQDAEVRRSMPLIEGASLPSTPEQVSSTLSLSLPVSDLAQNNNNGAGQMTEPAFEIDITSLKIYEEF
jgi:hypothetical protein